MKATHWACACAAGSPLRSPPLQQPGMWLGRARARQLFGIDCGAALAWVEHALQVAPGVARGARCDLLGRPLGDDAAAALAALGTQVDHPVRGLDDVEVVLDH